MDIEEFRNFCLSFKGVTEEFPFDNKTLTFKVMGKLFALTGVDTFSSVNLKCDPEKAIELRDLHDFIKPGFHMNKRHWNSVYEPINVKSDFLKELITDSYDLVKAGLTKKLKKELENL